MRLLSLIWQACHFAALAFTLVTVSPLLGYSQRQPPIDSNLSSKAISRPEPAMPPAARAVGASGKVTVDVTVDEKGNVIAATATSGHPLLRGAAEQAALKAKFKPFLMLGTPINVKGMLTYIFENGSNNKSSPAEASSVEKKDTSATTEIPIGGDAAAPPPEQPAAPQTAARTGGFAPGHRLEGRYKKSGSFEYFTFYADGSVKLSAAAAGTFRGGDYAASSETHGKYSVNGHSLTLVLDNGTSRTLDIAISRENADYSQKSPTILQIDHATYGNVD